MNSDRSTLRLPAIAPRSLASGCRRAIGAAALIAAGTFATGASSCGYEDPSSVMVQRGVLNLSYPNALYVVGALTQARMEGVVGRPTAAPASKDLFGSQFQMTARMLEQFAGALRIDVSDDMAFSMVLIEPMLWTRFALRDGRVATWVHVDGPAEGAPVVIATEAALEEIASRRLTPKRAEEMGLLRIYGDPVRAARLRAILTP